MATAWAEAVVAATDAAGEAAAPPQAADRTRSFGAVIAAAMLLPGVVGSPPAQAQGRPEAAVVSLRTLSYKDSQPGLERISVFSPSFRVLAPLSEDWWVDGTLLSDSVSGASPRYHTAISSASRMTEERRAGDLKVTRYFHRSSVSAGVAGSTERDYRSVAASLEGRWSSDDQNTSFNAGIGGSSDRIEPVNYEVVSETKRVQQLTLGATQVVTRNDLVQAVLTYSNGRGYFSDPYKVLDVRPRLRRQATFLLRWNHHLEQGGSTVRGSYRAYQDSFGIQAHTLHGEWVAPVSSSVRVIPSLRLYSQSAAYFYSEARYDPTLGEPYPVGYNRNTTSFISLDHRLSAFGAVTLGLGMTWNIDPDWTVDGRFEAYEQRGQWAWDGNGSEGLATFRARWFQIGLSRRF